MKSVVTYYSFSGNTERVIKIFSGILREKGDVAVQRLVPKNEITSFLAQCRAARAHQRAELEGSVTFDASPYDLALIASPVWAFAPVPAVNTYLDKLNGLHGKKVIVLLTSGSGLGVRHCFKSIRMVLESKGASQIVEINIPDRMQRDEGFISDSLRKVL